MQIWPRPRRRPEMVSDRKRTANRANAAKSSGPRSANGKSKVARNAQTHGLFSIADRASTLVEVETLARELAGGCSNEVVLVNARSAAEAEIDLRRVRRSKLALIDRALEFGSLDLPRFFATDLGAVRWLIKMDNWCDRRGAAGVRTSQHRKIFWPPCRRRYRIVRSRPCLGYCPSWSNWTAMKSARQRAVTGRSVGS